MPESAPVDARPSAAPHDGLAKYWRPKYWSVWALWLWMKLTAVMPLSWALWIHERLGGLLHAASSRQRAVVMRNLELCFPELSNTERELLAKRHFAAVGAAFAECALAWCASDRHLEGRFEVIGLEHLQRALELGKGVLLYTGHFTGLEICGRPLKQVIPLFAAMFSHRSNALLDEIQRRGRVRCAHQAIPSDRIRATLDALARNAVVWYAPDQVAQGKNAALIPFFGEPAMTNTVTSKLARVSGAVVVPFSYCRIPGEARYRARFHAPLEDFPTDDPVADTRRLVAKLEEFIRACPEQYLWGHKKFKGRPGLPDPYSRTASKATPPADESRTHRD
jgi:KDO2-lipid IV(A) lauroyltransferase